MSDADNVRYIVMRLKKAEYLLNELHDAQRACFETHGLTLEDDGMDELDHAARDLTRVISECVWEDLVTPSGDLPDADELADIVSTAYGFEDDDGGGE